MARRWCVWGPFAYPVSPPRLKQAWWRNYWWGANSIDVAAVESGRFIDLDSDVEEEGDGVLLRVSEAETIKDRAASDAAACTRRVPY
jgi:hypothetical protein